MFGYIAINKAEMKFKDYDIYHSYYCGLCHVLKEKYGRCGQMTLSFDMTFLILLLTGLYEPKTEIKTAGCIAHPLEKHAARTNELTDYAAAVNLILSYYKCKDDWEDERRKKSCVTAKLLAPKIRMLKEQYPEKLRAVSCGLKKLSMLEQENEQNADIMAGVFGEIMAELFVYRHDEWEVSLRKLGFFLGKFIYLMDAYEDVEKDIRTGNYNPFKAAFAKDPDFAENCRELMTMMMAECSRAFERLPILLYADILRNILYSGVWCRYTMITARRAQAKEKKQAENRLTEKMQTRNGQTKKMQTRNRQTEKQENQEKDRS